MRNYRAHAVLLVALAALSLAGCTNGGDDGSDQSEPSIQIKPVVSYSDLVFPVARYAISDEDQNAYLAAVAVEQRACARRFGVEDTMKLSSQPTTFDLGTVRRYGVVKKDEVDLYGYNLPPDFDPGDNESKANGDGWDPSAMEQEVMQGVKPDGGPATVKTSDGSPLPKNGCGTEGFRQIWGSDKPPTEDQLVDQVFTEAWTLTLNDSRAIKAAKVWASCMSKHGYTFKHRWDAGNSVKDASQGAKVRMAKLDLSCALKTNYLGVWNAVDAAYQQRLITKYQGQFEAAEDAQRTMMSRVAHVLRDGA